MATKNLIPRGDGEGGIGKPTVAWGSGVFKTGVFESALTISGVPVLTGQGFLTQNSDGNVGIGTTDPLAKLHIAGDSSNLGGILLGHESGTGIDSFRFYIDSENKAHITRGESEKITILNSGNVGIGNTSPREQLHLGSDALSDKTAIRLENLGGHSLLGIARLDNELITGSTNADLVISNKESRSIILGTNNTERMRIDSDGNVGIGTTSPDTALHISSPQPVIRLTDTTPATDTVSQIWADSDTLGSLLLAADITNVGTDPFVSLRVGGLAEANEKMRIDSDGNVGIGTTNPSVKLEVNGDILALGANVSVSNGGSASGVGMYSPASNEMGLCANSNEAIRIDSNGNVGIGTTSPNAKLAIDGDLKIGEARINSENDRVVFDSVPAALDSIGNPQTFLTAEKLGLGTTENLAITSQDIEFKLLTDENRFVVGTTGEGGLASGWYRFNDFNVKGATDVGAHALNPVDTRIYSDEDSFVYMTRDAYGNRVAHLVGGDENPNPANNIALGLAIKIDDSDTPEDIEFTHTDGEQYSLVNGDSDSKGVNGLPIRQGFQTASIGAYAQPLLIDGGYF